MLISRASGKDYGILMFVGSLRRGDGSQKMSLNRDSRWITSGTLVIRHMVHTFNNKKERKVFFRQVDLF